MIRRMQKGLEASITCDESCRAKKRYDLQCPNENALLCFSDKKENATKCRCNRHPFLMPSCSPCAKFKIALLIAGYVRSFTSPPITHAYSSLIHRFTYRAGHTNVQEVALIAALGVNSRNRRIRAFNSSWEVPIQFIPEKLNAHIESFGVPWRARYMKDDNDPLSEARHMVENDPIKRILMRDSFKDIKWNTQPDLTFFIRQIVAFDLLLSFERQRNVSSIHVAFVRPDMMYFTSSNPILHCDNAINIINDQFALMPRSLAGFYFSRWITDVRWQINEKECTQDCSLFKLRTLGISNFFMPYWHLAYYGVPFAGSNFELDTALFPKRLPCSQNIEDHWGMIIVRDTPHYSKHNSSDNATCYVGCDGDCNSLRKRFHIEPCYPHGI